MTTGITGSSTFAVPFRHLLFHKYTKQNESKQQVCSLVILAINFIFAFLICQYLFLAFRFIDIYCFILLYLLIFLCVNL